MNSGLKPLLLLLCLSVFCGCLVEEVPTVERGDSGQSTATAQTSGEAKGPTSPEIDWKQFRGPGGVASTDQFELPLKWNDQTGVLWRVELLGRGASSPIVANDRIFLTAASGYGMSAETPGNVKQLKLHVICLNRTDGKLLWQREIEGSGLTQKVNSDVLLHGFASSTPVADDDRVYAFFGATGLFAFDHDGNLDWQADLGFQYNNFGSSASPILHDDLVIVNASIENETVYAVEKATGRGVWKIDGIKESFSMPVVAKNSEGVDELVVLEKGWVRGFDPATGDELWTCKGIDNYVVSAPLVKDGVCYCNGGIQKQMMAIKLGGRGDVTETHKIWEVPAGANVPSPTLSDDQLYLFSDRAIFQTFDAKNGELISKTRLPSKTRSFSSHLHANGLLYVPIENNGVVVCEANPELKQISHNQFKSDKNSMKTSLVPTGREILLRNDQYLYLIGKTDAASIKSSLADAAKGLTKSVVPRQRYDFKPEYSSTRPYLKYLDRKRIIVDTIIISPYRNLMSEEQIKESSKLISSEMERFVELRAEHQEAYWNFLKSGSEDTDGFLAELKRIEKATEEHANKKIRVAIKRNILSEAQMAQHLLDAAERRKKREARR